MRVRAVHTHTHTCAQRRTNGSVVRAAAAGSARMFSSFFFLSASSRVQYGVRVVSDVEVQVSLGA